MTKRRHHCSSFVGLKRHRSSVVRLFLPHDVVGLTLERLSMESLYKFKYVSKTWKSTIESQGFQERQLNHRKVSRGPDLLLVSLRWFCDKANVESIALGSSVVSTITLPTLGARICHGNCDGLLCLYGVYTPSVVVNPATRWHQTFPLSNVQLLWLDMYNHSEQDIPRLPNLGFGRDKFTCTYKPVWLYNSSDFGLDNKNVTTCEVFDFRTNSWRYVHPSPTYRINDSVPPVYLDGSLHWLTEGKEETKVLSFDLHTETFHILCKAPFAREKVDHNMFILDNRLCVSEKDKDYSTQVIWSLQGNNNNKTWNKLWSIEFTKSTRSWFNDLKYFPLTPVAVLDKTKLLFKGLKGLVIHDLRAKSFDLLLKSETLVYPVYYYQSLFSTL